MARKQDWARGTHEDRFRRRLEKSVRKGDQAFWASIAGAFPEATTGDYPPEAHQQFQEHLEWVVLHWLLWNAPPLQEMANDELERRSKQGFEA